jgi:hypothetical protein
MKNGLKQNHAVDEGNAGPLLYEKTCHGGAVQKAMS